MNPEIERQMRELLDKQAIRETMVRMTRAFDRLDEQLAAAAFHEDAVFEHWVFPQPIVGAANIARTLTEFLSNDTVIWCPHLLCQTLIEVHGDTAFSEDHALTCRQDRSDPRDVKVFIRALRLLHRWERRDGKTWKVAFRTAMLDGFELSGSLPDSGYPAWAYGQRGPGDIVYDYEGRLRPGMPYDRNAY